MTKIYVIATVFWIGLLNTVWSQATPGFNTEIPEQIMTPDTVETSIGTLEFFDGLPDDASVQRFTTISIASVPQKYF